MANHLWQENFGPVGIPLRCLQSQPASLCQWFVAVAVDRLWLNPLASIPGSRLAALTGLYESYYECILGGKYVSLRLRECTNNTVGRFLCHLATYETQAVPRAHCAY